MDVKCTGLDTLGVGNTVKGKVKDQVYILRLDARCPSVDEWINKMWYILTME